MSTWSYAQNGQPVGPVETPALVEMLRRGTLPRETLEWTSGMAAWAPASTIPELGGAPSSGAAPAGAAPPLPPRPESAAPPPVAPPVSEAADIDQNKIFAVLAYLGILFLVPLLAAPNSKFARYHTNQGIVLFLATLIVCGGSFFLAFVPLVNCVAWMLPFAAMVWALVLMIMGIINAVSGQFKPLPLIGHFELIK